MGAVKIDLLKFLVDTQPLQLIWNPATNFFFFLIVSLGGSKNQDSNFVLLEQNNIQLCKQKWSTKPLYNNNIPDKHYQILTFLINVNLKRHLPITITTAKPARSSSRNSRPYFIACHIYKMTYYNLLDGKNYMALI